MVWIPGTDHAKSLRVAPGGSRSALWPTLGGRHCASDAILGSSIGATVTERRLESTCRLMN